MKTVSATIVYSVGVTIEVEDDTANDQIAEELLAEAEKGDIDKSHPIIHDCSMEELIG